MSIRLDRVETYSGYRGEESPRAFYINDEKITVVEILETWIEEGVKDRYRKRFFLLRGSDDIIHTICQGPEESGWFYKR